ncbi:hypothetical protein O181_009280 [Austropuccinia psidii MF-1]|uniref:Uncharacterized protein n=1 Tax=Austropuccinia psidii MF-1 TaxID=1389203 RepID=A0A9Q3BR01_9BASI|nr:hypothetical protein [Austropuccinia psidii MF-1]
MTEDLQHTPFSQFEYDSFIMDEVSSGGKYQTKGLIYLESKAGKTIVNDLLLLLDPVKVNKKSNEFSSPVKVAHNKTPKFKGVRLNPANYIPEGPVNLLPVSQLRNHGLEISTKTNIILIKQWDKIISTSHREANILLIKVPSLPPNSIYKAIMVYKDWQISLGHQDASDTEKMINSGKIKGSYPERNLCKDAKIKNRQQSKKLPTVTYPFSNVTWIP